MKTGKLVISLDFELMWGVQDVYSVKDYGQAIQRVQYILPKLIKKFNEHEVVATFATVGMLFAENKAELAQFLPTELPNYTDQSFSPYGSYLDSIDDSDENKDLHFGKKLIELLKKNPQHEIASHTFSHYYCLEQGQDAASFKADLMAAIKIAEHNDIQLQTIIFPRNQISQQYLDICKSNGIHCFRGTESVWFQRSTSFKQISLFKRAFRFLDTYINLSGSHLYDDAIRENEMIDLPSSRFLRPVNTQFPFLEKWKLNRIKDSMTKAARSGSIFHLWWHPHNFAKDMERSFDQLNSILEHYSKLNEAYGFESKTMASFINQS